MKLKREDAIVTKDVVAIRINSMQNHWTGCDSLTLGMVIGGFPQDKGTPTRIIEDFAMGAYKAKYPKRYKGSVTLVVEFKEEAPMIPDLPIKEYCGYAASCAIEDITLLNETHMTSMELHKHKPVPTMVEVNGTVYEVTEKLHGELADAKCAIEMYDGDNVSYIKLKEVFYKIVFNNLDWLLDEPHRKLADLEK